MTAIAGERARRVLPALDLLPHTLRIAPRDVSALITGPNPDVVLVDGAHGFGSRSGLAEARDTCRLLRATGLSTPLVAIVDEAGLAAVSAEWALDDVMLVSAGPAEIEARLRLVTARRDAQAAGTNGMITAGELAIDPTTYAAKLKGAPLDLTYKEFELLKFLAQHPGRVFTRDQLLREVWGYDYFGGHRTVDVHVRRLRAKLGSEYESMIGTVRQVGYKLVLPPRPDTPILTPDIDRVLA
ncbi:winged helix-turn-helix transcriptional regulator [Catenuloplanes atrovinosus]|uniref:DNA-binding response OmpR family regulator n=1 Tax=Catenuloplanes atrovinosus TaxID=137266 RepID=A0AAE3YV39_9ACTN|nr:response regulator transcription factor [Catenuloplanes atrovinosus]MDR7278979.1 DNA-binding response OmpR family regulator [Catenuloplanes atrovinosus]